MDKLLTVKDASSFLSCHEMTVRKLIAQRRIPFIRKKGIGIRIRKSALEEWLDQDSHPAIGWKTASNTRL
ncbi:helix-turn-helix domain-containing protein [Acidobacteriota bacterium]